MEEDGELHFYDKNGNETDKNGNRLYPDPTDRYTDTSTTPTDGYVNPNSSNYMNPFSSLDPSPSFDCTLPLISPSSYDINRLVNALDLKLGKTKLDTDARSEFVKQAMNIFSRLSVDGVKVNMNWSTFTPTIDLSKFNIGYQVTDTLNVNVGFQGNVPVVFNGPGRVDTYGIGIKIKIR